MFHPISKYKFRQKYSPTRRISNSLRFSRVSCVGVSLIDGRILAGRRLHFSRVIWQCGDGQWEKLLWVRFELNWIQLNVFWGDRWLDLSFKISLFKFYHWNFNLNFQVCTWRIKNSLVLYIIFFYTLFSVLTDIRPLWYHFLKITELTSMSQQNIFSYRYLILSFSWPKDWLFFAILYISNILLSQ